MVSELREELRSAMSAGRRSCLSSRMLLVVARIGGVRDFSRRVLGSHPRFKMPGARRFQAGEQAVERSCLGDGGGRAGVLEGATTERPRRLALWGVYPARGFWTQAGRVSSGGHIKVLSGSKAFPVPSFAMSRSSVPCIDSPRDETVPLYICIF